MTAFMKVYTDSAHASEVAHTANISTTLNNGGTLAIGATAPICATTVGMPSSGAIDIDSAGTLETLRYVSITGSTLNLAKATAISHANSVAIVQWYYSFPIGDQTNGIPNDGTASSASTGPSATWYYYNAGDQVAQSVVLAVVNVSPTTTDGYADTNVSTTSATTGYSQSISIGNVTNGAAAVQFWIDAQVPSAQSAIGNPQVGVLLFTYSSV